MASVKRILSFTEKKLRLRLEICLLIVAMALYTLFAFVISPLIVWTNNDATIGFDYLPDLLDFLHRFNDMLAFFICYAITEFGFYRFTASRCKLFIITFSLITIYKYLMNLIGSFFLFDSMPASSEELKSSISAVIVNTVVELGQYLLVVMTSHFIFKKHHKLVAIAQKNAEKLGMQYDSRSRVFPFKKLFSKENPLQFSALITAAVVAFVLVVNRLRYDIFIGLPTSLTDALWIVAGYGSDLLFAFIGYLIMLFVFNRADTQDLMLRLKDSE